MQKMCYKKWLHCKMTQEEENHGETGNVLMVYGILFQRSLHTSKCTNDDSISPIPIT